jgi:dynein heavy chain
MSWDEVLTHQAHVEPLAEDASEEEREAFEAAAKQAEEAKAAQSATDLPDDAMIIFCDYLIPGADPRVYDEVNVLTELQPLIEEYLSEYNAESKQPMHLVMFMDAIEHVSRISRVFRQPQGNALLLGVGGSGRKSLSMLSTYMADYTLYTIQIAKGYGKNEWRENLRECLLLAGLQDKPVVFLFDDTQIIFESMTEDVNAILNSGDVPNLYAAEDLDAIASACKEDCVRKRLPQTKLNLFSMYLIRVKRNIHVCLTMSPLGEAFRERLRKFPSIVNCCTIDWFSAWPDEALQSVAMRSFEESETDLGTHTASVVSVCKIVHQSVVQISLDYKAQMNRYNYVTPTSYLELLSTYRKVLSAKRVQVGTLKDRLQNGLDKLISTAAVVSKLQADITALKPVLVKTVAEVEEMIVNIDKDKADAAVTQAGVEKEEAEATEKAAATKAIADDAQKDLDEVRVFAVRTRVLN